MRPPRSFTTNWWQAHIVSASMVGALLLVCGCATLDTSKMSEHCQRLYDACLNSCPSAQTREAVAQEWRFDIASCTDDCNRRAKQCS